MICRYSFLQCLDTRLCIINDVWLEELDSENAQSSAHGKLREQAQHGGQLTQVTVVAAVVLAKQLKHMYRVWQKSVPQKIFWQYFPSD